MPLLNVTADDLKSATLAVYGLDPDHAPNHVWVDHFDDGHSYVRAIYGGEFCRICAKRLLGVVSTLRSVSANKADVTVVIYAGGDGETLPYERQRFVRNRLSGFNGQT